MRHMPLWKTVVSPLIVVVWFAALPSGAAEPTVTDQPKGAAAVTHQVTANLPQSVSTDQMGGVPVPSKDELLAMHDSPYILHARGGKLVRVPVEKTRLPDDSGDVQAICAARGPKGAVYVGRKDKVCKSVDGGRSWTSHAFGPGPEGDSRPVAAFTILADGTFIGVGRAGGNTQEPLVVLVSEDEGRSWQKRSQFEIPVEYKPFDGKYSDLVFATSDGTLLCPVDVRRPVEDPQLNRWYRQQWNAVCFRSIDDGHTWEGPSLVCHWWAGAEGGLAQTPSGKIVAVVRYQRPLLASDPPDLVEKNKGYTVQEKEKSVGWPYKTVFMIDSHDGGRTWRDFRQVCTRFGQTRGYPAALSDGTVVVVHDTRYGPGGPGSRAMISRDEAVTWQDEVYYLDYSAAPGSYNSSVVLEDDVILTIVGSTRPGEGAWDAAQMTAIRWQPVVDK